MLSLSEAGFEVPPKTVIEPRADDAPKPTHAGGVRLLIIEPASIEQLPQLMAVSRKALGHLSATVAPLEMNSWVAELFRLINGTDRKLFVALHESRIVGWHIVNVLPVFYAQSVRFVHSVSLWVEPEFADDGAHALLLEAAESWGRALGARLIVTGALGAGSAHAFEAAGYTRSDSHFRKGVGR